MLVIRFQRIGKKHQASFRIVLQDSQWKPQGKALELLGFYNPHSKEKNIQAERVNYWISKGARPSPTIHNLLVDSGVIKGEKVKAWKPKKGKKGAEAKTDSTSSTDSTNSQQASSPPEAEAVPAEPQAVSDQTEAVAPIEAVK